MNKFSRKTDRCENGGGMNGEKEDGLKIFNILKNIYKKD